MTFINPIVSIESLPAAEQIDLQPLHPSYLKLLRIEWTITAIVLTVIAAALIIFIPEVRNTYWWAAIAGGALFLVLLYYFSIERSFPHKGFAVRTHDAVYRYGWLIRTMKVCPFNRVQNCSVQSGPLERKFGLATLVLFTAGVEGADMKIPGLTAEEADNLRQFILSRINGTEGRV